MQSLGTLYSLNPSLFDRASLFGTAQPLNPAEEKPAPQRAPAETAAPAAPITWREAGATCITCGIGINAAGFGTPAEQRAHFKTDWHRLNVRRKLAKQPPISEEEFEKLLENDDEVSSISGSGSSSEDDEGRQLMATAVGKQLLPLTRFRSDDGRHLAVWRCLLMQDNIREAPPAASLLQGLCGLRSSNPIWVVVMLQGGHFAAVVARMKPPSASKPLEPFEVLEHKTLHRYVVRAKAGGKQSAQDASGKFAKSAGARLRRYNEAALEREILELLSSWQPQLAAATHIFLAAPSTNARIIVSSDKPGALSPQDPRLRRLPFVTRRPTFSEAKRALCTASSVYELAQKEEVPQEQTAAAAGAAVVEPVKAVAGTSVQAGSQAAALAAPVDAGGAEDAEGDDEEGTAGTSGAAAGAANEGGALHRAAKEGEADTVRQLLEEGHDPCVRDGRGRTPYAVASSKEVRDAMRRFAGLHPDRWDYAAAGLPGALTPDMEAAQKAKQAERKAKQKAKQHKSKEELEADAARAAEAAAEQAAKKAAEDMAAFEAELASAVAAAAAASSRTAFAAHAARSAAGARGGAAAGAGRGRGGRGRAPPPPPPPTATEMAARREAAAAAAEARAKALQSAQQQQRLWSVRRSQQASGKDMEDGDSTGGHVLPRVLKLLLLPTAFAVAAGVQAMLRRSKETGTAPQCSRHH